jgi:hypothetical protein
MAKFTFKPHDNHKNYMHVHDMIVNKKVIKKFKIYRILFFISFLINLGLFYGCCKYI